MTHSFKWSVLTGDTFEDDTAVSSFLLSGQNQTFLTGLVLDVIRYASVYFEDYLGNEEAINDWLDLLVNRLLVSNGMVLPIGTIVNFGGDETQLPDKWLFCDGTEYAQSAYPELYAVISDNLWGSPSSGNFCVPDLRNRSAYGYDNLAAIPEYQVGNITGEKEHTLTIAEMPAHDHDQYWAVSGGGVFVVGSGWGVDNTSTQTQQTGDSEPHNNLHPVAVCPYIIYAGR